MKDHPKGSFNLYQFQQDTFPILTAWSAGSIISGILWMRNNSPWYKGFGSQFAGWGAVDLILAILGLRSAHTNLRREEHGEIAEVDHNQQTVKFERLLWINAGLDTGYIAGGGLLIKRSKDKAFRQGMGWGIVFQGAFLLIWDFALALLLRQRSRQ